MKKIFFVRPVLIALSVGLIATQTYGADLKAGIGYDQGLSAVMQFNERINLAVGNKGGALDVLLNKGGLTNGANWYFGAGGWLKWNDNGDEFGFRLPIGVELGLLPGMDLYGQVHPELSFNSNDNNKGDSVDLGVGVAFGLRFQF